MSACSQRWEYPEGINFNGIDEVVTYMNHEAGLPAGVRAVVPAKI